MRDPIAGLSSMATRELLAVLVREIRARHDVDLRFASDGGVDVERRVRDGEQADVVVLAEPAMAGLAADGLLVRGWIRPLFVSDAVVAVPEERDVPELESEEDLRDLLAASRRVACSTGPSGVALVALLRRWGLDTGDRVVRVPPGTPVASLLADGRADVGVQQGSELTGRPGVRVIGPLPGEAAVRTTFAGGVATASVRRDRAAAALGLLADPGWADVVADHGMATA